MSLKIKLLNWLDPFPLIIMLVIHKCDKIARAHWNPSQKYSPCKTNQSINHLLIQRFLELKQILKFKSIYLLVNDGDACFRATLNGADVARNQLLVWSHSFRVFGWIFPILVRVTGAISCVVIAKVRKKKVMTVNLMWILSAMKIRVAFPFRVQLVSRGNNTLKN